MVTLPLLVIALCCNITFMLTELRWMEGGMTGTWYIHEIIQVGLERHQAWLDHICIAGVH